MDHQNNSFSVLSKFSRLRRKPLQPLTDLTELYNRTAHQTIYYRKLTEDGDFNNALFGWKSLNTLILYELQQMEKKYPHPELYNQDESSLMNGVRNFHMKCMENIEYCKTKLEEKQGQGDESTENNNNHINNSKQTQSPYFSTYKKYHSPSPCRNKRPHNYHHHESGRLLRTLRDPHQQQKSTSYIYNSNNSSASTIPTPNDNSTKDTSAPPFIKHNNNNSNSNNNDNSNSIDNTKTDSFTYLKEEKMKARLSPPPAMKQEIFSTTEPGFDIQRHEGLELIDLTSDDDSEDEFSVCQAEEKGVQDKSAFEINDYYNYKEDTEKQHQEIEDLVTLLDRSILNNSATENFTFTDNKTANDNNEVKNGKDIPLLPPPIPTLIPPELRLIQNDSGNTEIPSMRKSSPSASSSPSPSPSIVSKSQKPKVIGSNSPNWKPRPSFLKQEMSKSCTNSNGKPIAKSSVASNYQLSVKNPIASQNSNSTPNVKELRNYRTSKPKAHSTSSLVNSVGGKKYNGYGKKVSVNTNNNSCDNIKPGGGRRVIRKVNSSPATIKKKTKSAVSKSSSPAVYNDGSSVNRRPVAKKQFSKKTTVDQSQFDTFSGFNGDINANSPIGQDEREPEISKNDLKNILEEEIINSIPGVDKNAARQIFAEIVVSGDEVHWEDIAGLETAKSSLKEAVVYPFLRPDLFRGLREPIRGMLLFGPPGTGKTMLARAVATESQSTFFSISASSLTSKYLGESEKLVRALFAIAKKLSPSIIFVDEIDSIMGARNNEGENESSRRIKNEFLVQWSSLSSATTNNTGHNENSNNNLTEQTQIPSKTAFQQKPVDDRVLVLAATNLPWSIDEAARRRFVRRQYIPLPEDETRLLQLKKLMSAQNNTLEEQDFEKLVQLTKCFSGSDITSLCKDAAMGPLRELGEKLLSTPTENIRAVKLGDFVKSLQYIKPSVSTAGLADYEKWATQYGSSGV
ncbi:putative AAA family ATPase SAP1 SCDLUD_000377 [Saccharomycodes ludwigii]|uniref:putative AAA family ATPase SAP1 n=1 Tax=Saccharomycodes ludwigii TaxID=36035 RepID=UPI001E89019E|nr:hypothetical protein SCDLUD_000377 [Saccharomycodes ludwigii]KAH3902786.1 hypothetical protein SCDLUD_000377 [Saccharomycodes ludwigii]